MVRLVVVFALLNIARAASAEPARSLVVTVGPEGTPWADAARRIAERATSGSAGTLRPRVMPGGAAGDEVETARQCAAGRHFAWGGSAGALASSVPALDVFEVPFLFEGPEEVDVVIRDVAPLLAEVLRRHGLVLYGAPTEVGWRSFAGPRPLRVPADFEGLRVRSQENPIHLGMWRALGAKPRAISVLQTLDALKLGMVEAFDQSPVFMFATSWYQAARVYTLSRHIYQLGLVVLCRGALKGLAPGLRPRVLDGALAEMARVTREVRALERDVLAQLEQERLPVVPLTAAQRAQLHERTLSVREAFRAAADPDGRRLLEAVEAALARYRRQAASPGTMPR